MLKITLSHPRIRTLKNPHPHLHLIQKNGCTSDVYLERKYLQKTQYIGHTEDTSLLDIRKLVMKGPNSAFSVGIGSDELFSKINYHGGKMV